MKLREFVSAPVDTLFKEYNLPLNPYMLNALEKIISYMLGVLNALTIFEGDIDSDMRIIDPPDFEFEVAVNEYTSIKAYLTVPKALVRTIGVSDIDIHLEMKDKVSQVKDILGHIADYSSYMESTANCGSDYTKDFEELNLSASEALTLLENNEPTSNT